jgi:hypothetical protein
MEQKAQQMYDYLLEKMVLEVGNGTTYSTDLYKIARKYLGGEFHGVYASDLIPKLSKFKRFAILNLDQSNEPGSHWIGCVFLKPKHVLVFDSFGRRSSSIIPSLLKKYSRVQDTDYDIDQRTSEDNCGARTLAWLLLHKIKGKKYSQLI